jgi:hypothetical protein
VPALLSLTVPLKVNVGAAAVHDASVWLAGLTEAVAARCSGRLHDSVYGAGAETATGLDTTRTASPLDGSA